MTSPALRRDEVRFVVLEVTLMTGGGSSIGRETAVLFEGARVVAGRRATKSEETMALTGAVWGGSGSEQTTAAFAGSSVDAAMGWR